MWIARHVVRVKSNLLKPGCDFVPDLRPRMLAAQVQTFADNVEDSHSRVQGGIRILEDHLHVTGIAQVIFRPKTCGHRLALKRYRA